MNKLDNLIEAVLIVVVVVGVTSMISLFVVYTIKTDTWIVVLPSAILALGFQRLKNRK